MMDSICKIEKLVAGGRGLVRDRGETVFVPFVIPGEEVRIEIVPGRGKTIQARVLEIVTASPDRVAPPCPRFGICGGCQLQHLAYPAQLRAKAEILAEGLMRIAGLKPPIPAVLPSSKPYHYRSRLRFHVVRGRPGFFAEGTKDFLAVDDCLLAAPELNHVIPFLPPLLCRGKAKTVELISDDGVVAVIEGNRGRKIFKWQNEAEGKWTPAPEFAAVFQQVNPEQNEALRDIVAELLARISPRNVIELYAGMGNLTGVIAATGAKVTAVDSDEEAIALGRRRLGNQAQVRFVAGQAEDYLRSALAEGPAPDLIVLDPPRTGAKAALPAIIALRPPRLLYVSCDGATLARDLKTLLAAGYQLNSLTPLDMFPQTAHLEVVAWLAF